MVSEPGVSVPLWNAMEVYIHFHWKKEYFVLRLNLSEKNVDSVHFTAV